jgi:polysaccharide export outer membrane protein
MEVRKVRFPIILAVIAAIFVQAASAEPSPETQAGYRLAPGDRLTVTINGQPELSGEYLIDGAGEIHMPLINAIRVGRSTIDEARRAVTAQLVAGVLKNPSVSVRVSEFRPVYVLGDVRSPGGYPFRFGMNGMGAIALAGGIGRPDLGGAGLADILSAEEKVKVLTLSRLGLLVRLARLESERKGDKSFEFATTSEAVSDDQIAKMVREEQEQMRVLLDAYSKTIALLERQRPQIEAEIQTTKEQLKVELTQLALIRDNLGQYNTLVKRGLGRSTTELDFQRQAADREGIISRLKGDLSRLETKLGDLDIRAQDAENARQIRIAGDVREAKTKLSEFDVLLPSARELLELRRQQAVSTTDGEGLSRTHRVMLTRVGVRRQLYLSKGEDVTLEPGDIVEVNRLKSDVPPADGPPFDPAMQSNAAPLSKLNAPAASQ